MKLTATLALSLTMSTTPAFSAVIHAKDDGALGLYQATDFNLSTNSLEECAQCATIPQARWYFAKETVALPKNNVAEFSTTLQAQDDIQNWLKTSPNQINKPPLIWLGAKSVISQAKLNEGGDAIMLDTGENLAFSITPKIATNLSYWDNSTLKFFNQRDIRLRGEINKKSFTARTIWPLDYKLSATTVKPLKTNETLKSLVQFEQGGAKSQFESRLLWQEAAHLNQHLAGKSIIGIMLNGAQGDDDEAFGGHFGLITGRMEADGNMSRWLVNNYYNLGANSEKGIISAVTPLDKYLMDLNNGQSYYRPSYMLIAVLKNDQIPHQIQSATNRVYNHFYRHDFDYDHSRSNCAGISIDTLRSLGWNIPKRGVTSQLKATAAYFYIAATTGSLTKSRAIYDYLNTETTRLLPALAFDAIGEDIMALALPHQYQRSLNTSFTKQLNQALEAVYFVRIPQIPSSRAFGAAPVYSFDEYMKTAPANHDDWKVIPTTPLVFPDNLRDGLALKNTKVALIPWPVTLVTITLVGLLFGFIIWLRRKLIK